MSTDHNWGPTVLLFLTENNFILKQDINETLRSELPYEFFDYPVNVKELPDEPGTDVMEPITSGPVNHRVYLTTVSRFIQRHLNFDITQPILSSDWLSFPSQKLRSINNGAVHYNGTGELTEQRARFNFSCYAHE